MKPDNDFAHDLSADSCRTDSSVSFRSPQEAVGRCPHCGEDVRRGQFGYYCTGKCGMSLAKVYGKVLTDFQLLRLLSGKEITFTAKGIRTVVMPYAVQQVFNGKTFWQWAAKKGKE